MMRFPFSATAIAVAAVLTACTQASSPAVAASGTPPASSVSQPGTMPASTPASTAAAAAGTTSRASATATSTTASAAGTHSEHVITVGGVERRYLLDLPARARAAPPLIVALHGATTSADTFEQTTHIVASATPKGYVVVAPQGLDYFWNAGFCCGPAVDNHVDDEAFITAVLADVRKSVAYDKTRVYIVGHSNGGMLAYKLACDMPTTFAAIAVVAADYQTSKCRRSSRIGLLHVHGLADETVPFAGGIGNAVGVLYPAVLPGVNTWAKANGCSARSIVTRQKVKTGTLTVRYSLGCSRRSGRVRLITIAGLPHVWPDDSEIDLANVVTRFFALSRR